MRLRALIADDEPLARERLRFLLSAEQEVEVAGECRNGREVIAALKESRFDVLFLDIQMPGKDGFDVIDQVGPAQMPVTVFVTAHNEYAVQAFEVDALDYLTKPVEPERLRATLVRVKEKIASHVALMTQEQMKSVLRKLEPRQEFTRRLLVHNGSRDCFVNVHEIDWIEAADYCAKLHAGTSDYVVRVSLGALERLLDPAAFVRVHRSAIVNLERIKEIVADGSGDGMIVMGDGTRVRLARSRRAAVERMMGRVF